MNSQNFCIGRVCLFIPDKLEVALSWQKQDLKHIVFAPFPFQVPGNEEEAFVVWTWQHPNLGEVWLDIGKER